jgi:hypothetical protein
MQRWCDVNGLHVYGADGPWVALFRQATGYIDTLLLQDRADAHRLITVDRFCTRCGSRLYSRQRAKPEWVRIRVGTIDEPLNVRPAANYHAGSKCNWWEIRDRLPGLDVE